MTDPSDRERTPALEYAREGLARLAEVTGGKPALSELIPTTLPDHEQRVWQAAYGAAYANTELLGLLLRLLPGHIMYDTLLLERRQQCEKLADEAVKLYRVTLCARGIETLNTDTASRDQKAGASRY